MNDSVSCVFKLLRRESLPSVSVREYFIGFIQIFRWTGILCQDFTVSNPSHCKGGGSGEWKDGKKERKEKELKSRSKIALKRKDCNRSQS